MLNFAIRMAFYTAGCINKCRAFIVAPLEYTIRTDSENDVIQSHHFHFQYIASLPNCKSISQRLNVEPPTIYHSTDHVQPQSKLTAMADVASALQKLATYRTQNNRASQETFDRGVIVLKSDVAKTMGEEGACVAYFAK